MRMILLQIYFQFHHLIIYLYLLKFANFRNHHRGSTGPPVELRSPFKPSKIAIQSHHFCIRSLLMLQLYHSAYNSHNSSIIFKIFMHVNTFPISSIYISMYGKTSQMLNHQFIVNMHGVKFNSRFIHSL